MKEQTITKNKGFTLIELLVVIAIISLLVSILLPSLAAAKELAYAAQCGSDERSIGIALSFYAEDWVYIPVTRNDSLSNVSWARVIQTEINHGFNFVGLGYLPYALGMNTDETKGIKVMSCSSNKSATIGSTWAMTTATRPEITGEGGNPTLLRRLDSDFPNPGADVLVTEAMQYDAFPEWFIFIAGQSDGRWYMAEAPHNDKSNCLFADMHVERVNYSTTSNSGLDLPDKAFTESTGTPWKN